MSKPLPINRVAALLGYADEKELMTILRLIPGLPYETRRGFVYANPDELGQALADRGIVIPADLRTVEDNPEDRDDDEASSDDDDDDDEDQPRRRRR